MADIPHVVDSTGTVLNQYTLTHADNTTEVVKLDFNPSVDYVAGTPFNAATMNPLIDKLNGIQLDVTETTLFNISGVQFHIVLDS